MTAMRDIFPMPDNITFAGELFFGALWLWAIGFALLVAASLIIGALSAINNRNPLHVREAIPGREKACLAGSAIESSATNEAREQDGEGVVTKQAIVERTETQVAPSETAAVIQMIERAAKDPNVDVDKMERLLTMRRQMIEQQAAEAFSGALTRAQSEMRPVAADANNPQTRSKYASYLALDKALRPIYTRHGFALSFNTADGGLENHVRVVCDVSLGSYSKRYQVDMPADGKGAKGNDVMTKTHAVGAAMTYGQRYLLKMIFNIAVGTDDDGNTPPGEAISQEQADQLRDLIESTGANIKLFLQWANVARIEDLAARHYEKAVNAVRERAKKKQEPK